MEQNTTLFLHLRNKFIIPKIKHGIKLSKINYWSLKKTISEKFLALNKNDNIFEFTLNEEDYYKAIHSEIELFMNKSHVQYADFYMHANASPCWSFVTLYYFSYFANICFLRFQDRGMIYLNESHVNNIKKTVRGTNSEIINLSVGNYFYEFKGLDEYGKALISMVYSGNDVHKNAWVQLEKNLESLMNFADSDDLRYIIPIIDNFRSHKVAFPSAIRNQLNYQPESSLFDIEKSLPLLNLNPSHLPERCKKNEVNLMNGVLLLAMFLFDFNNNLYKEYLNRSDFGNDFALKRSNYLTSKGISI